MSGSRFPGRFGGGPGGSRPIDPDGRQRARLTVSLPPDVVATLKGRAAASSQSVSAVVEAAIVSHLEKS